MFGRYLGTQYPSIRRLSSDAHLARILRSCALLKKRINGPRSVDRHETGPSRKTVLVLLRSQVGSSQKTRRIRDPVPRPRPGDLPRTDGLELSGLVRPSSPTGQGEGSTAGGRRHAKRDGGRTEMQGSVKPDLTIRSAGVCFFGGGH